MSLHASLWITLSLPEPRNPRALRPGVLSSPPLPILELTHGIGYPCIPPLRPRRLQRLLEDALRCLSGATPTICDDSPIASLAASVSLRGCDPRFPRRGTLKHHLPPKEKALKSTGGLETGRRLPVGLVAPPTRRLKGLRLSLSLNSDCHFPHLFIAVKSTFLDTL